MQCVSLTKSHEHECAWERSEPNEVVFFMYAVVIPVLTMFGLMANFLNAIVFMRPKMTPSVFTYLAALSWVDCLCCFIILMTSLSRSIFFNSTKWIRFDFQWQTPLFGILTGGANWILAAVTLDRMIYLRHGLPQRPPMFCTRRVAKRNICAIMLMSAIINTPYFFIFVVRDDGTFYTTSFYYSKYYKIHNWFSFTVLCIVPGLFLLIGNTVVIVIFRRWVKKSKDICNGSPDCPVARNRHRHQVKLTITVITVVFLYLVGELPAHITSRKSALNLLFGGDVSKVKFQTVEEFEVIFLTLNALQLSFNIVIYAIVNPSFMTEFFIFLREACDFILLIMGISAIYKLYLSLRNVHKSQDTTEEIRAAEDFENHVSVSYYNETFLNDRDCSIVVESKVANEIRTRIVHRHWKSCLDVRLLALSYEVFPMSGKILQRHSMSF